MANVYYSDNLGTDLNVFEKKTKGGEPFYYIYLNKNLITDADVEKLVKIIENSIANKPKVKQKKGKLAYQITWSFSQPTPLATQQILFDVMFSWLKGYGYVDTYQPKGTQPSVSTPTQQAPTTSPTTIDFRFNDLIWLVDDPYSIERVESPPYQRLVCSVYNPTNDNFVNVRYNVNLITSNIINGLVIRKILQEGDVFETRLGNVKKTITKIENIGQIGRAHV